jgi:hypothetical protein
MPHLRGTQNCGTCQFTNVLEFVGYLRRFICRINAARGCAALGGVLSERKIPGNPFGRIASITH